MYVLVYVCTQLGILTKANPQQHDALGVVHCPICPLRFIVLGNAKNVDEA